MYINFKVEAAKRAAELCEESKEQYRNSTIIAALKQAAREFSKENNSHAD